MRKNPVDVTRTDLTTQLGILASQLRNDGFALLGVAGERCRPGEREHHDLDELKASLDRTADLLEAAGARLCGKCRLIEVSERITIGDPQKDAPEPPKRPVRRGTRAGHPAR